MRSNTRPIFDVASEVLIRELTPYRPENYEVVYSEARKVSLERSRQRLGCRCVECLRHRQTAIRGE